MKLLSTLSFLLLSTSAFSQTCYVDMVDSYNRVVRTFSSYESCYEGMKECRKTIRLQPQLGGVDCVQSGNTNPTPTPNPVPDPTPDYNRLPAEVLRMTDIEQAINHVLTECYVLPNVDGWANQLYVGGRFQGNFQNGTQDNELRRTLRDLQYKGLCLQKNANTLQVQFRPSLIQEAIDYQLAKNCHVIPNVDGWAHQLIVDGAFLGNFNVTTKNEEAKLRSHLALYLASGRCQARSYEEVRLLQNPYLIQDFANFQYRGCHVKLNVQGWNQLYVNNVFKGNFDNRTEVRKLQNSLVSLVMNGTCRFDPI